MNISKEEGAKRLIELSGLLPQPNERTSLGNFVRSHSVEEEEKARKRKSWSVFEAPTQKEIKAIAELRGLKGFALLTLPSPSLVLLPLISPMTLIVCL